MHARFLPAAMVAATALSTALPLAAQAPAPAAPQVTITGLAYTQWQYNDFPTAGVRNNSFDVKRAYVNVIGRFAGGVYTRITADIFTNADSSRAYRIKYAYFGYTPTGSPLTFKLGEIHTAWLDWEETLWEYRMQGTMPLERNGYVTSSDLGGGIDYKLGPDRVNGQFTIVNGEGYSKGTGDFRKDAELRLSARVMDTDDSSRVGGLRVTGFAHIGKYTGGGDRNRYLGMVSYRSRQITLAGEFASTKDALAGITGRVLSGFGVYKVPQSKVAVIGRLDIWDPNTSVTNDKQTRIIGGVSYQVSPNLRLLADLDRVSFQAGTTAHTQGFVQAQFTF